MPDSEASRTAGWRRPPSRSLPALLPVMLLLGAAALAVATFASEAGRRGERAELVERVRGLDLPAPRRDRLAEWAGQQDEPMEIRLGLGRLLVSAGAQAPATAGGPAADDGRQPPLDLARDLAAEVMRHRPAAWRAPTLLASALYLQRSQTRDVRLITEASDWDRPLARARRLSPNAFEPVRVQAVAYLELWPTLPEDKRAEARRLLSRAFTHADTFDRLIGHWLQIAEDEDERLEEALSVVPPQPRAWDVLGRRFAEEGDWDAALLARDHWRQAQAAELKTRLRQAALRAARGDAYRARLDHLDVLADAPADADFAPLAAAALSAAPAGPPLPSMAEPLARWLDWALALDLVGEAPLGDALSRLAGSVAGLPDAAEAHAAVAAGDLAAAEAVERRAGLAPGAIAAEPWGGYLVAKAARLGERCDEVAATLARLPAAWRDRPSALAVRQGCDETTGGLPITTSDWWTAPAGPGRGVTTRRIELYTQHPATGLRIDGEADAGTLVEVLLDGRRVAARRARARRGLEVEAAIDAGLHLVEVVTLRGGFIPGAVSPAAAQDAGPRRRAAQGDEDEGVGR